MLFELAHLIDALPGLAWTALPDGRAEFLNRRWLDYTGLTDEQATGLGWNEAIHPDDRERVSDYWRSCVTSGISADTEARMRRHDGAYRWFRFRASPVRDAAGNISRWFGITFDIEDRKHGEEVLKSNERSLSLILNTIPAHIYVLNTEGAVQYVNQAVMDYTGLSIEDVQQEDYRDRVIHPEDFKRVREPRAAGLRRGAPFSTEQRVLGNDGQFRWFLVRYKPLLNEEGRIVRWYVAAFDIEDRKRAVEQLQLLAHDLQERERESRLIVETIPGFVASLSPAGEVEFVNNRLIEYCGQGLEAMKQWGTNGTVHVDDLPSVVELFTRGIASGEPYDFDARIRRHDGIYRWFQVRGLPLRDTSGQIVRWYSLLVDIEDRKRAEDAQVRHAGVRADVNAAFSKATRLEEILRGCTEAIVRHLDAAFARIWLMNKDEGVLELQASAGMYTRLDGSYSRISVGDLKVGWIAREKKAHLTNDVMNDPRVRDKGWAQSQGMVAFAGHPLVVEDRLIGVVALFARRPLPESILDTLASVAGTIAQGIERKRAEHAVREREREARLIVDSIPGPVALLNRNGDLQFVNRQIVDYTGRALEELKQWGTNDTVHPDDLPHAIGVFTRSIASGSPYEIVQRLRRSDGAYRWFQHNGFPVRDSSRDILLWCVLLTDIDDRKQAEVELSALKDQLYKENLVLRDEVDRTSMFEEIVGTSPSLRPVLARVAKVAPTDSTVFICGETGTGKELIARALHKRSRRSERPFVSVNCAAIAPTLISSELFGHEKGAFTGATQRRLGRFELADGGTIFLDEVGELLPDTQVTLLRVLQEREFERVGGTHPLHVDVRVIAATNRDLKAAIPTGSFRQDLYY